MKDYLLLWIVPMNHCLDLVVKRRGLGHRSVEKLVFPLGVPVDADEAASPIPVMRAIAGRMTASRGLPA